LSLAIAWQTAAYQVSPALQLVDLFYKENQEIPAKSYTTNQQHLTHLPLQQYPAFCSSASLHADNTASTAASNSLNPSYSAGGRRGGVLYPMNQILHTCDLLRVFPGKK